MEHPPRLRAEPRSRARSPRFPCLFCLLSLPLPLSALGAPGTPQQEPAAADTAQATPSTTPSNPFAGFETHHLSNGVKVWFKRLPGAPNVSVSAGIAVGSDADPPGKEQLAHFTEHMLFSDHDGRTEQEIKDAVEGLGGRRNGFTYSDHTYYYVTIGKEHGLFAIEWLAGIMSPHAMDPEVVERGRQPVLNEIGARERDVMDHIGELLNPDWLSPPGFYEREFGIEPVGDPSPYYWRTLHAITPEDLRWFQDRYYAPGAMTVTIVGDLDPGDALAVAERTFGSVPARPVHGWDIEVTDPGRRRVSYDWAVTAAVSYQSRYKLFRPGADELLTALFVRDLLNRRLGQRLRYGERKAVYGASFGLSQYGPAVSLTLITRIDDEDYDYATGVIDEEIEALRTSSLAAADFEADRAAVVERLRASNQTAESLNFWTRNYFYDPDIFADFPDVVSYYEDLTQDEVAAFARQAFAETRQVLSVTRPQPVDPAVLVAGALLLVWLTLEALKRRLTTPVQMKEIRYIARFRLPLVLRVLYTLGLIAALAVVLIGSEVGYRWVAPAVDAVESHALQLAVRGALVVLVAGAACLIYALAPRKLLLFTDHIRIKSRAWRSRALHAEDIADISVDRFPAAWLSPRILRGLPLAFGLLRPGIHLRPRKGRSYFFHTRDTKELAEVLSAWWGSPVK